MRILIYDSNALSSREIDHNTAAVFEIADVNKKKLQGIIDVYGVDDIYKLLTVFIGMNVTILCRGWSSFDVPVDMEYDMYN